MKLLHLIPRQCGDERITFENISNIYSKFCQNIIYCPIDGTTRIRFEGEFNG